MTFGLQNQKCQRQQVCCRQACYFQSTSLMQVDCQDVLLTSFMQVISITCSKSANIKVKKSITHIKSVTTVSDCAWTRVIRTRMFLARNVRVAMRKLPRFQGQTF